MFNDTFLNNKNIEINGVVTQKQRHKISKREKVSFPLSLLILRRTTRSLSVARAVFTALAVFTFASCAS